VVPGWLTETGHFFGSAEIPSDRVGALPGEAGWLRHGVALLRCRRHQLKKIVHASEQERPDVAAAREAWIAAQPDLNSIEQFIAKLKAHLRKAQERPLDALCRRIGQLLDLFQPNEYANVFANSGYART